MSNDNMIKDIIHSMGEVYSKLADQQSRDVYEARLMFSICPSLENVHRLALTNPRIREFISRVSKMPEIVIFGSGRRTKSFIEVFSEVNVSRIIDSNPDAISPVADIPISDATEYIHRHGTDYFLISSSIYEAEMRETLKEVDEEHILNWGGMLTDILKQQYFEIDKQWDNEIFVDMGCWDGKTSTAFAQIAGANLRKIIAFEPDETRVDLCLREMKSACVSEIEIVKKGAWSGSGGITVFCDNNQQGMIKLSEKGNHTIETISLDEYTDERVSFIKMDIEGAELEALRGCKKHITKYKPMLAICVYHRPEDIVEIPKLILEMNPDYRLYLRHYTPRFSETVLYAI